MAFSDERVHPEFSSDKLKIKFSGKLFYREYAYKLQFNFKLKSAAIKSLNDFLASYSLKFRKNEHSRLVECDLSTWSFLEEWYIMVYTNDLDLIENLIEKFSNYIVLLVKPIQENQIEFLKRNKNHIIRRNLFFKRYQFLVRFNRYRIVFSPEGFDKFKEKIFDYFNSQEESNYVDYRFTGNYMPILYIKNKSDLIMIKLIFSEYIDKIETITLLDGTLN